MQVGKYASMRIAVPIPLSIRILRTPFPQIWRSIFFGQIYVFFIELSSHLVSLYFHEHLYDEMVLVSHYRVFSDFCLVITCSATTPSSTFSV